MDDGLYSVCELTYEQKRAFNRLKRLTKHVKMQVFSLPIIMVI
nr:MAG TPA: p53-regulated apoptosis-inducing protein 1 [Caudoviricetes sp.]